MGSDAKLYIWDKNIRSTGEVLEDMLRLRFEILHGKDRLMGQCFVYLDDLKGFDIPAKTLIGSKANQLVEEVCKGIVEE